MKNSKSFEATSVEDYKVMKIKSSAFEPNSQIPEKYTCDGMDTNPPLELEGIPEKAKCLAIIVEDPDAPKGTWTHWIAWDIPVTHHLKEGFNGGVQGMNDFGKNNYGGPCPPSGTHRYYFKIYALDDLLNIKPSSNKKDLERAMSEHIVAFGELVGKYSRMK